MIEMKGSRVRRPKSPLSVEISVRLADIEDWSIWRPTQYATSVCEAEDFRFSPAVEGQGEETPYIPLSGAGLMLSPGHKERFARGGT
jgi:hypothetical protein